ncbi:Cj0069 family protein [Sphingobium yanoikuyae]|uniref:Cj0069 family protein n=1 Tax=Sphingobium yanoikuyae TaxID=13690 RepID=UPI0028A7AB65|nr:Cj0069 family protein [Sphingobium yanoikuyae]
MTSGPNIALLWRGQAAEWTHRFHEARQWPIMQALRALGATARPVLYRDEAVREIRDELLSCDAVLVWVNPLDISGDRSQLDPMLREVAGCGVVVSAHPDVIAKIGVKEVLYTTRSMEWGSDVDRYVDAEGLRARFPEHLAAGPRVLKPNYGNGGRNVWRVQLDEARNAPALKTSVKVQEARQGSKSERISLAECLERWVPFLNDGGVLIDQAYQPQSSEGMVRCYVCGHRVVGFGHNLITALMTPTAIDTTSSTPQPMGRAMFGPEVTRFAALRKAMEDRWIPEMQRLLSIADHDLPLLWDADFLFRLGEAISDGSYALCEINASSVAPFPPSAVQPVAAAAIGRALAIRLTKETSNPH